MAEYYLGIDIGASSGRHMLAHLEEGKMILEEVHRFPNGMAKKDGELCWDTEALFREIKEGMRKCAELGKIPVSVGIDTWAVDFVLLDEEDKVIGNTVGYRDSRTQGMDEKVYETISLKDLYSKTGIQKQMFNSIYQLMAIKEKKPEELAGAKTFLMIPDYFHFLLCGKKCVEYTNATTTQLVSPETKTWDMGLIHSLGYPTEMFPMIRMAGTVLGDVTEEIAKEIGYSCKVVLPATHDTGSAVLAVPSNAPQTMYISSGTWSLMGVERMDADCSDKSMECNFTNEGGYDYRFRYLKNIMGLWMIQSLKKEINDIHSFAELCDMASKERISSIVDCNDDVFMAPESMIGAVKDYCRESGQQVPETIGELAAVIYNSLAVCYKNTVKEIEAMTGVTYDCIHVVGGGANAQYLNELTARETGKTVCAGPTEATVIGNLTVQMLSTGEMKDLTQARKMIFDSFDVKTYTA
ncbi:MAG: rhamnulokinase [Lachnospiraceae bacterium]|nr:rhamnulokinase [Lachnospiraceae bacterium]